LLAYSNPPSPSTSALLKLQNKWRSRQLLAILNIIQQGIIRDWTENDNVLNGIKNGIDDYLYDVIRDQYHIDLTPKEKDGIISQSIQLAKNRRTFLQ
jgi:hypothetical protein